MKEYSITNSFIGESVTNGFVLSQAPAGANVYYHDYLNSSGCFTDRSSKLSHIKNILTVNKLLRVKKESIYK